MFAKYIITTFYKTENEILAVCMKFHICLNINKHLCVLPNLYVCLSDKDKSN